MEGRQDAHGQAVAGDLRVRQEFVVEGGTELDVVGGHIAHQQAAALVAAGLRHEVVHVALQHVHLLHPVGANTLLVIRVPVLQANDLVHGIPM